MFYLFFFFPWLYCQQQFKTWISSLSLDDIERLATIHMKEASLYWCNVITVNSRPRNFGISAKFVVPKQPLVPFDLPLFEENERSWKWYRCPILSWLFNPEGKKDVMTLLFIATQFCLNVSLNIHVWNT